MGLYDIKARIEKDNMIFVYNGPVTQEIIEGIGSSLQNHMQAKDASTMMSLKVFAVFVESMQNIMHYSYHKTSSPEMNQEITMPAGIVAICHDGDNFYSLSGNLIEKTKQARISSALDKVCSMDKQQLKAYYKQQRKNGPDSESKGAGLGFIDMARKASKPIEYQFLNADDDSVFFVIKVTI